MWLSSYHVALIYPLDMSAGGMLGDTGYGMHGLNDYDMYEEPDKMTYTEQANKRSNCRRLTRYSSSILVRNTFHANVF